MIGQVAFFFLSMGETVHEAKAIINFFGSFQAP